MQLSTCFGSIFTRMLYQHPPKNRPAHCLTG